MRAIVQRVNYASLSVDNKQISAINEGLLVLVGYKESDDESIVKHVIDRIIKMRIFRDDSGKLNKSIKDIGGELMIVSNFTLYGNPFSGRRPDFSKSAKYDVAKPLYDYTLNCVKKEMGKVASGVFGAHMHIDMSNDGPVTMVVEL